MDKALGQGWWDLHLRVVRGESLSAEEQEVYQSGLTQHHSDEKLDGELKRISQVRARVMALDREHAALQADHARLDEEIAALEAALGEREREMLGVHG